MEKIIIRGGDVGACYGFEDDVYVVEVDSSLVAVRGIPYAGQSESTIIEVNETSQQEQRFASVGNNY